MRRIRLFLAASLLVALAAGVATPASAAAPELFPMQVECSGETLTYGMPTHSWSWTMHELDGTSRLVVHRWTIYAPPEDGGTQVYIDRAANNPRLELCTTRCPLGYPIEIWGIRTP